MIKHQKDSDILENAPYIVALASFKVRKSSHMDTKGYRVGIFFIPMYFGEATMNRSSSFHKRSALCMVLYL